MTIPLVLFAIAATGGLTLAYLRFNNKPLPLPLAMLHGLFAASGLIALAMTALDEAASSKARLAFFLFLGAALGGFTLLSFHLRKKALPLGIVAAHGLTAIVAFVILLLAVYGTD